MGVLEGKVAFISGGARGQGRSHAIKMAGEGADIITFDICESFDTVANPGPTEEDLAQTVKEVEALGRRIVAQRADATSFWPTPASCRSSASRRASVRRGMTALTS